jgi:hypothetical protein
MHHIKNAWSGLWNLATPSTMPLTALGEMLLAKNGVIILLFYMRHSIAEISLFPEQP